MKKYLVIANYQGDHSPVVKAIREIAEQDNTATFRLIVPATPPLTHAWTWTEREAYEAAQQRLNQLLGEFKRAAANITGEVVNYDSLGAVEEALKKEPYDELLVSTPPDEHARTTFEQYEHQVRRFSDIPMRHIVAPDAEPVPKA